MDDQDQFAFDINLDFLDQHPHITAPDNDIKLSMPNLDPVHLYNPPFDAEELSLRIANVDNLVQQIKRLQEEKDSVQKQLEDFNESAVSIRELYESEKAERIKLKVLSENLHSKCSRLETELTSKTLDCDQLSSQLENEKGPLTFNDLAVKFLRAAGQLEEERLLTSPDRQLMFDLRDFVKLQGVKLLPLPKRKSRVPKNHMATQCDLELHTTPKSTITRGTQYVSSTTTRGTSTSVFIQTQTVGTNFPEMPAASDSLVDILNEMICYKRPISPIMDLEPILQPFKQFQNVGTITHLNNVRKPVDYVSNGTASIKIPQIKHSNSRPPSRNMFDGVKNESYWLTMGNNIANQTGLPAGPYNNGFLPYGTSLNSSPLLMQSPFAELWNLIGHTVVGLFQNQPRSQLEQSLNQTAFSDLNERIRSFNDVNFNGGRENLLNNIERTNSQGTSMRQKDFYEDQLPHQDFQGRSQSIATSPIRLHPGDVCSSHNCCNASQQQDDCTFFPQSLEDSDIHKINLPISPIETINPEGICVADEILKLFPESNNKCEKRIAIKRLIRTTRSKKARLKLAEHLKADEQPTRKSIKIDFSSYNNQLISNKLPLKRPQKNKSNDTETVSSPQSVISKRIRKKQESKLKPERKPPRKILRMGSETDLDKISPVIDNTQPGYCSDDPFEDFIIKSRRGNMINNLSESTLNTCSTVSKDSVSNKSNILEKVQERKSGKKSQNSSNIPRRKKTTNQVNDKNNVNTNNTTTEEVETANLSKFNEIENHLSDQSDLDLDNYFSECDELKNHIDKQSEHDVKVFKCNEIEHQHLAMSENEYDSSISENQESHKIMLCKNDSDMSLKQLVINVEVGNQSPSQKVISSETIERSHEKQSFDDLTFKTPDKPVTHKMSLSTNSTFLNDILSNTTIATNKCLKEHNTNSNMTFNKFFNKMLDNVTPPNLSPISVLARSENFNSLDVSEAESLSCDEYSSIQSCSEEREINVRKRKKRSKEVFTPPTKRSERIKAKKINAECVQRETYFPIEIGKYTTKKKQSAIYNRTKMHVVENISNSYQSDESCFEKSYSNLTINCGYFKESLDAEEEVSDNNSLIPGKLSKDLAILAEDLSISSDNISSESELENDTVSVSLETTSPIMEMDTEVITDESSIVQSAISVPYSSYSPASPPLPEQSSCAKDLREPLPIPLYTINKYNKSLLSRLITTFNEQSSNKLIRSLRETETSSNARILEDLKLKLISYINLKGSSITVIDLIHDITELSNNISLIAQSVISVIESASQAESKTECPLAEGYLGETHCKISELLWYLKPKYPSIIDILLRNIEKVLFKFKSTKISLSTAINLTQLYMDTTRRHHSFACKNSARRFICKCIYYYNKLAIPMIYEVLCFYPTVLPHREDRTYDRSDALITVIQHLLMNTSYDMTKNDLKTKDLLSKLRYQYHFEPFKPPREEVIENFLAKIRANKCKNVSYSFALLCKRMTYDQVIRNILQQHLLPLANEYCQRVEESAEHDEQIECVLETISMVIKPLNVDTDILSYTSIFTKFLNSTERQIVQEAAIQALLRVSRFGIVNSFNAIYNFNPKYNLKPSTRAMLKSFIYKSNLYFLRKLEYQARLLKKT